MTSQIHERCVRYSCHPRRPRPLVSLRPFLPSRRPLPSSLPFGPTTTSTTRTPPVRGSLVYCSPFPLGLLVPGTFTLFYPGLTSPPKRGRFLTLSEMTLSSSAGGPPRRRGRFLTCRRWHCPPVLVGKFWSVYQSQGLYSRVGSERRVGVRDSGGFHSYKFRGVLNSWRWTHFGRLLRVTRSSFQTLLIFLVKLFREILLTVEIFYQWVLFV